MLPVESPFKIYTGLDGKPLDNGYIYFGQPNKNPLTAPVTVYWDVDGTQPAPQPLRTVNGYIMRGGTPANVFFSGSYSELVKDSKGRQVFYARTSDEFSVAAVISNFLSNIGGSIGASLIGFIQAGVGAVKRTVQDVLRERISVKDFGAAGDGVTNDAAAIQKAATAATGKVLFFPPGSYVVNDGFSMSGNNSHIVGYGAELIYKKTTATFQHCVRLSGNDCSVSGLKITSPAGLVRDDTGFGISIGSTLTPTTNVTVRDCTIDGIASAGIWFSNVYAARAIGNAVRNCKADGIHFSDGCFSVVASANVLSNNGDDHIAVVNDVPGEPFTGSAVIQGNVIDGGTAGHGIVLIGAFGGVVSNNFIINTAFPAIGTYEWKDTGNPTFGLVIEGNSIANCGSTGATFGGCGINLNETGSATIRNNTIRDISYDGSKLCGAIRCASATELAVTGNHIYNVACDGVVVIVASTSLSITGNVFGFNLRTPVLVSGTVPLCTVSGNTFSATAGVNDIDVNLPGAPVHVFGNRCGKAVVVVSNNPSGVSLEETGSFTPVITAKTGTVTAASGTMTYQRRGRFLFVDMSILVTANGTGSDALVASLPFNVVGGVMFGRENNLTGAQLTAVPVAGSLSIRRYDNSYPGANGASMTLSGMLRVS